MILKGESGTIEIAILKRSNTNTDDYWDANWLESEIKVDVPGFKVCYGANLRVEELQKFYEGLTRLLELATNKVEFTTMEEGFYLKCIANSKGHILCSGLSKSQSNVLEFELETDIISISNFTSELKSILELYPLIGSK